MTCAYCGHEITESYFMVGDNFLQLKYFEDPDGQDNVFCSKDCLCEALSVVERGVADETASHLLGGGSYVPFPPKEESECHETNDD